MWRSRSTACAVHDSRSDEFIFQRLDVLALADVDEPQAAEAGRRHRRGLGGKKSVLFATPK